MGEALNFGSGKNRANANEGVPRRQEVQTGLEHFEETT